MDSPWIAIAKIGRPHGVRGEMRAWPFDPSSEMLFEVDEVRLAAREGSTGKPYTIKRCRRGTRSLVLSLKEVTSRHAAEPLNGMLVMIPSEILPELEDGEYYHHQLIGAQVVACAGGQPLGVLEEIIDNGAHDVLVIRDRSEGIEVTIPFVEEMVELEEIEGQGIRIVVDPPEGLIEATRTSIK